MNKLFAVLRKEFLELLPPTLFFFIALNVVVYIRVLMLKGTGLPMMSFVSVTIAALLLGKAVLIADMLPIINRFPEKPLAYNIAWKTAIYLVASALIHYAERLFDFSREAGGIVAGNQKLLEEVVWPHFWAVQIILCILIVVYCTAHELTRVLGAERLKRLFFGPVPLIAA